MTRRDKENYYLDIAQTVAERGTCLRRNFGAIIVKNDQIIATGYNGAPRGRKNCCDMGVCMREKLGIPKGERYELCRSVHAEANAIISAARNDMIGSTLTWSAGTRKPMKSFPVPAPAPCAAGSSSTPASSGWSSVTRRRNSPPSMSRNGWTTTRSLPERADIEPHIRSGFPDDLQQIKF